MIEAALVVAADFSGNPTVLTPQADADDFFDALVWQVKHRNPSLD